MSRVARRDVAPIDDVEEALFLDALRLGHRVRAVASGRSMLPLLLPGVEVLIEPPPFSTTLCTGDLLLARAGGCLRLHRFIEERPDGFILKGDAVLRADPLVEHQDLYGRVVMLEGRWLRVDLLGVASRRLARVIAGLSRLQWRLLGKAMSDS